MCTLILAHRFFPDAALVVAANRDELLARPASGPRLVEGTPRVLMPRDEVAGGSWLGLNEHGLFVGITNRVGRPPDPARRSRGHIVAESLQAPSARSLHAQLSSLDPALYNPFHLLYADGRDAFVTWADGQSLLQYEVNPGIHVITERSLGGDDHGRAIRALAAFEERIDGRTPSLDELGALLALHVEGDSVAGLCVHAESLGFGTRSSFVYVSGPKPIAGWREGAACGGQMESLGPLLTRLFAAPG
ncbi:MAG: NRDE family protein [Myxococcales bacterium]|jgi:uncharacterized protein with NRDE domain